MFLADSSFLHTRTWNSLVHGQKARGGPMYLGSFLIVTPSDMVFLKKCDELANSELANSPCVQFLPICYLQSHRCTLAFRSVFAWSRMGCTLSSSMGRWSRNHVDTWVKYHSGYTLIIHAICMHHEPWVSVYLLQTVSSSFLHEVISKPFSKWLHHQL